ncbi:hypothetical protein F5050DRAFT_1356402 [Lentinula boryana]|uniref:Uncharacterized protein n=1 Tax=Lentinula boryana TaxID=40481 RepID=A0ABQ8QH62_9AGAR|nr:hypothetical protein F5050DRAFT_1356402 [Lentinula boryana]
MASPIQSSWLSFCILNQLTSILTALVLHPKLKEKVAPKKEALTKRKLKSRERKALLPPSRSQIGTTMFKDKPQRPPCATPLLLQRNSQFNLSRHHRKSALQEPCRVLYHQPNTFPESA